MKTAVELYRILNNNNDIPEIENDEDDYGDIAFTADQMIWFANQYAKQLTPQQSSDSAGEEVKLRSKIESTLRGTMKASNFDEYIKRNTDTLLYYAKKLTRPTVSGEEIRFAEWLYENRWYSFEDGKWRYTFEHGTMISEKSYEKNYVKTTQELHDIFTKELNR